MRKMNLSYYIAARLGIRGDSSRVMLRVAMLGVSLSVAVMLVSLGVVGGFRGVIAEKIRGFAADMQITAWAASDRETDAITYDTLLASRVGQLPEVASIQRIALKTGVIRGDSSIQGIQLKGVGAEADLRFFESMLVGGALPRFNDTLRSREALLSQQLCARFGLQPGDRFELLFVGDDHEPRRERLRVAGIYRSGLEEFDQNLVIGDLGVVQRLNGWSREQIGGYEIRLHDPRRADLAANRIRPLFADQQQHLRLQTAREQYAQLFDWLAVLGTNSTIIIVIMLVVALVNMVAGLLVIVLEQTRTIGLFKALGMPNGMMQRIFIFRSMSITAWGMLWGNLAGLGLCLLQQRFHLLRLDPSEYLIAEVPIRLDWIEVAALNIGLFIVVTLAMSLPTLIISRITPDQSLRYQ